MFAFAAKLFASPLLAAAPVAPVSFVNDVVPVLTKSGCNAGACHAKAGQGQNGFRLSLLGFEPQEDYEHIVKEARGRRIFNASPDQSLLLLKATLSLCLQNNAICPLYCLFMTSYLFFYLNTCKRMSSQLKVDIERVAQQSNRLNL